MRRKFVNKADVLSAVVEESGVDSEACEKVLDALEKVLQRELSGKPGAGTISRIAGLVQLLASPK